MTVFIVLDAGEVIDRVYADYLMAMEHAAEIDGSVLACEVIELGDRLQTRETMLLLEEHVAQRDERSAHIGEVAGSTPAAPTTDNTYLCDADLPVVIGKICPHCGATPEEICRKK